MAQSTEVFDPGAVELPKVKLLGEVYALAEVTKTRAKRINDLQKELEQLIADGEAWDKINAGEKKIKEPDLSEDEIEDAVMRVQCHLIGEACGDAELGDKLFAAYEADEMTVQYLTRTATWVQQKAEENSSVGND